MDDGINDHVHRCICVHRAKPNSGEELLILHFSPLTLASRRQSRQLRRESTTTRWQKRLATVSSSSLDHKETHLAVRWGSLREQHKKFRAFLVSSKGESKINRKKFAQSFCRNGQDMRTNPVYASSQCAVHVPERKRTNTNSKRSVYLSLSAH